MYSPIITLSLDLSSRCTFSLEAAELATTDPPTGRTQSEQDLFDEYRRLKLKDGKKNEKLSICDIQCASERRKHRVMLHEQQQQSTATLLSQCRDEETVKQAQKAEAEATLAKLTWEEESTKTAREAEVSSRIDRLRHGQRAQLNQLALEQTRFEVGTANRNRAERERMHELSREEETHKASVRRKHAQELKKTVESIIHHEEGKKQSAEKSGKTVPFTLVGKHDAFRRLSSSFFDLVNRRRKNGALIAVIPRENTATSCCIIS